jgi:hypothetical protein
MSKAQNVQDIKENVQRFVDTESAMGKQSNEE